MALVNRFKKLFRKDSVLTEARAISATKSIEDLDAWFYKAAGINTIFGHVYACTHAHELTEYGRIIHFEVPDIISRLTKAAQDSILYGR